MSDIVRLKAVGISSIGASDLELMGRIATGEASALEQLLQRYWDPLVRYGTSFLNSVDAAEDVAQETFVRVWAGRTQWEPTGSVQAFLYRIARNLALNERRRRRVRLQWLERLRGQQRPQGPQQSPPPTGLLESEERRRLVEQAIAELPARRREVFILAWFHQLSYREIGDVLGISPNTVSNHLTSANAELRRRLASVWREEP